MLVTLSRPIQPVVGERPEGVVADDYVVEEHQVEGGAGPAQGIGAGNVRFGGVRVASRMVVHQNQGLRPVTDCSLYYHLIIYNRVVGAAGGKQFNTIGMECAQYLFQPVFVEDRHQCPLYLSCLHLCVF